MKERESFSNRLGFIIVSVACAVGLGNIWLLPYRAGTYGGGLYVLLFIFFMFVVALPVMLTEYAVGRASKQSIANHYQIMQPKGTKWHYVSYLCMAGNYLLMMFYMTVCGFALAYLVKGVRGELVGASPEAIGAAFGALTSSAPQTVIYMLIIVFAAFGICFFGLQGGVERFGKIMMSIFFILIIILVIRSLTLPGALDGVRFLFVPNPYAVAEHGVFRIIHLSMSQAFFSLSVGLGQMAIFGSYFSREGSLFHQARTVAGMDLAVALLCLLMIFPAAFAFGISPATGAGLVFVTLPNVFNNMPGTYIWQLLFYVCLVFVSFSTAAAIAETVVTLNMDKMGWSRKKAICVNLVAVSILCLPATLGTNLLAGVQPLGFANFSALFSFLAADVVVPIGAFTYIAFAVSKRGWGYENYLAEINTGEGAKLPPMSALRFYLSYILPLAILFIFLFGHAQRFFPQLFQ